MHLGLLAAGSARLPHQWNQIKRKAERTRAIRSDIAAEILLESYEVRDPFLRASEFDSDPNIYIFTGNLYFVQVSLILIIFHSHAIGTLSTEPVTCWVFDQL